MRKIIGFIDAGTIRPAIVAARLELQSGRNLDWKLFVKWLNSIEAPLFDCHYFDAIPETPYKGLINFHNFLQSELKLKLHFTKLKQKSRQCPKCDATTTIEEQKGVDVAMAVSILKQAPNYDEAIIVSGDGDFEVVFDELRNTYSRRITVIGWKLAIAPCLKAIAHRVIYLEDFASKFIV